MLDNQSTKGSTLITTKRNNGVLITNHGLQNNNNGFSVESGKIKATKSTINKDGLWCNYYKKPGRHTKNNY